MLPHPTFTRSIFVHHPSPPQTDQTKQTYSPEGRASAGEVKKVVTMIRYSFWCGGREGHRKIQAFINKAYGWYAEEMKSTEDHSRYMYTLVAAPEPAETTQRPGQSREAEGSAKKGAVESTVLRWEEEKIKANSGKGDVGEKRSEERSRDGFKSRAKAEG